MKNIFIYFLFGFLLIPGFGYVQDILIQAEGVVVDSDTGDPIAEQLVILDVSAGGFLQQVETHTGSDGYFLFDSIVANGPGLLWVQTLDCTGSPHIQTDSISPASTSFWFDFNICTDSLGACQAFYNYVAGGGSNLAISFQNLSGGSYDSQLWDFGDGTSASLQNPVHLYNAPGVYLACLSIWSNDSFCYDSYCMDVIVNTDTTGCWNFFSYETWNQLDYTFNGESYPVEADFYFWDFGDGSTGSGKTALHTYNPTGVDTVTVFLTTFVYDPASGDTCLAASTQTFLVGDPTLECENWFDYTTNDNLSFEFFGSSLPPADGYFWDFGDGQTASGQNVSHTYASGTNTILPVSLVTIVHLPSGDSCTAFSEVWIPVGNNPECTANFSFYADSLNPLHYYFTDLSTGLVSTYLWDFGDGSYSADQDPTYVYAAPGNYTVCLTVTSDSLGGWCSDMHCDTLAVIYTLQAFFTASLDTLSGAPHQFYFHDTSIGSPDAWLWDFGDGQYSYEQHPVHAYDSAGNYTVCLTANRLLGLVNYESDYCQDIESPDYFDLGGQVYLDNIPMNNFNGDTSIVDTGIAYLYRTYENTLIPADTQQFDSYGYYWFSEIRAGDYIVRVRLTPGSLHFGEYVPAYHHGSIKWQEATVVSLSDSSRYNKEVRLKPLAELPLGSSDISGFVTYAGTSNPLMTSLNGLEVILLNTAMDPVKVTLTGDEGNFIFEGIPSGEYSLYCEASGLYTIPHTVQIDETTAGINGLQLQLSEQVLHISPYPGQVFRVGEIFPNPASSEAFIQVDLVNETPAIVMIYQANGIIVHEQQLQIPAGGFTCRLDIKNIPKGFYIIKVLFEGSHEVFTQKFVK